MYQKTEIKIASSASGLPWRASPFLPIESMAARQYSFILILATANEQQLRIVLSMDWDRVAAFQSNSLANKRH